jgi:hypothetical protein
MDDPFKPPQANLEVPRELGPAPQSVKIAFALLCAAAAVTLLMLVAMWVRWVPLPAGAPLAAQAASSLVGAAIMVFFAWKIRTGRNWARWVLAVFMVLGVGGWVISILVVPVAWSVLPLAHVVSGLAQTALQIAAVVLTFTTQARAWFRPSDHDQ